MESTAALIPFDRLFKFSASELNEEYRVNLFQKVKKENAELLGMDFGEGFGDEFGEGLDLGQIKSKKNKKREKEEDLSEEEKELSDGDDDELSDKEEDLRQDEQVKKKKKNSIKRTRELEYDYDDPFIDDSEITDVYQSVFELMRGGRDEPIEDKEGHDDYDYDDEIVKEKKERNFFVYRGTMTPEILAKEFEIDAAELPENAIEGEEDEQEDEENENDSNGEEMKKKKRKISEKTQTNAAKKVKKEAKKPKESTKPAKTVKPAKPPKQPKQPKQPKSPKKPLDVISQSAKKFNDIFSSDDANVVVTAVFNVNGVDANLLELREVLKRFRDAAVGTSFSPGKFPSILRPRLNETICTVLRLCRPSPTVLLPVKLFPALATFLPFSAAALNKLLTRKILGPLLESTEKTEIPRVYREWREMIEKRIIEGGVSETVVSVAVNVGGNKADVTDVTNKTDTTDTYKTDTIDTNTSNIANIANDSINNSPVKKRLKFNDEMRQKVFEIVRLETDLNNLICLNNFVESSASSENIPSTIRSVQSELNLRKLVYQKLANLSQDLQGNNATLLLSTTEISKEFGAQKRKHEKRISKAASEILFSEAELEEFLKELDVKKELPTTTTTTTSTVAESAVTTNATNTANDPLNLFANDQAESSAFVTDVTNETVNTSVFIDNNQQ